MGAGKGPGEGDFMDASKLLGTALWDTTLLAATVLVLSGAALLNAAVGDVVKLEAGQVSGSAGASSEMRVFKGVPFAEPPVGNLRWKAPQPVAHWDGVRKSDAFGPACMQNAAAGGAGQQISEDCLYLNIWTSAKSSGDKRPVMVWIYGGGYNVGSASQPDYDGEKLAEKGGLNAGL